MGPKRLKVVLVVSNLEFGGAQRQVVHLARNLDPERYEAHICSLSSYIPLADDAPDLTERLHVVTKRAKYDMTVLPRLRGLLRGLEADIVHGFLYDAQVAARIAGRWARVPVVIDSERNSEYEMRWLRRAVYRLTRHHVDAVIANSHAGARFHRRMHNHAAEQYHVVYNGVDTERFRPADRTEREAIRAELGLGPDALVIGIFGSFKRQKNHELFFRAAARLVRSHPQARLVVVGDSLAEGLRGTNENKQRIGELVDELSLRDYCLFLGNRSDPERIYRACDMLALSSHYEGTPNVLLEAMASGIPAVATRVGDNEHVIEEGVTGYLITAGDEAAFHAGLERLAADRRQCEKLGEAARRRALEVFSLRKLAENTGEIYETVWRSRTAS